MVSMPNARYPAPASAHLNRKRIAMHLPSVRNLTTAGSPCRRATPCAERVASAAGRNDRVRVRFPPVRPRRFGSEASPPVERGTCQVRSRVPQSRMFGSAQEGRGARNRSDMHDRPPSSLAACAVGTALTW